MGGEKQSSTTVQNTTSTPTPTAEETRLNQLDLQLREQNQGALGDVQGNSLNLANLLLKGQGLPGYLNTLPGGIDEATTQNLVNQSLRDIQPQFQGKGLLDSGVNASISARTAGDIRNQSAQFNIQNLMQLLNLATGNAAQVQAPIIGQSGQLGQRLAGLASTNTTGTSSTTQRNNTNPFLNSFAKGAGTSLGTFVCWIAAEVFEGGWNDMRTHNARNFFLTKAPKWMLNLYLKFGEQTAKFISDKPVLKKLIKPLFEHFASLGA